MAFDANIIEHLDRALERAMTDYADGEHAWAAFEAITLIEEVGKLLMLRSDHSTVDGRLFRNHREKYAFAVFRTLFVNSRVTRIYGQYENRFAHWLRDGELFGIRNAALYVERQSDGCLVIPNDGIAREDAILLVCIAGEVWAEVQGELLGTGVDDWQRTLTRVDEFRCKHWKETPARAGTVE